MRVTPIIVGVLAFGCSDRRSISPFVELATPEIQQQFRSVCGYSQENRSGTVSSGDLKCGVDLVFDERTGQIILTSVDSTTDAIRFEEVVQSTLLPLLRPSARRAVQEWALTPDRMRLVVDRKLPEGGRLFYVRDRTRPDRPHLELTISR